MSAGRSADERARIAALLSASLFAVRFVFFFVPPDAPFQVGDGTLQGAMLAVAEHAVLFPVVAVLLAPEWARAAGYGWLVVDMCTDILAWNGAEAKVYLGLRLGGHLSAAIWIAAGSRHGSWPMRWAGPPLAVILAGASFLTPTLPEKIAFLPLTPTALLLPVWLVLVATHVKRLGENARPINAAPVA